MQYYALALLLGDVAAEAGQGDVATRLREDALAFQLVADGGTALVAAGS
jgi:hypothetical protein